MAKLAFQKGLENGWKSGKINEKSGNFEMDIEWQPWNTHTHTHARTHTQREETLLWYHYIIYGTMHNVGGMIVGIIQPRN